MIALNVWSRGLPRLFCVLIGMVIGYVMATALGALSSADRALLATGPVLALPWPEVAWSFDAALILPFAAAALAATLKSAAGITTCQKLNDAEWRRADMNSVSRGVLADGLACILAGGLGTMGVNSSSSSVGLCNATGVLSRRIAYVAGVALVGLAFVPKLGLLLFLMPPGVAGAALLFSAAFILMNGVEIMTSRLLDARRTLIVGIPFVAGLSIDFHPGMIRTSGPLNAFVGSSLVLATVSALILNLFFRLGTRRTQSLVVEPAQVDPRAIEEFMELNGAAWGARRDVIDRAKFNLTQSVETIVDGCAPEGPLAVEARFDEFNLDIRISYAGVPLELPERRPSNEEIMESEEGQRRLAGFMLRRLADRVQTSYRDGKTTVDFHFDH
jgi:NCS2 family nucleobase:cation symporter-2